MKKLLLPSVVILLLASLVALAQDITNHAIPIGGGPGAVGWKQTIPGATGQVLASNGAASDPSFQAFPSSALDSLCAVNNTSLYRLAGTWGCLTGTSGGVPYFNSATTFTSSGLLTANGVVLGGGAGGAPTSTALGVANTVLTGTGAAPAFSATPTLGTNGGTGGQLTFNGSTSGSVVTKVPAVAGTTTFQYPGTNGTSGYLLQTDGAGITSWNPFVASGTGALNRTWQSKARDWVSVLDFAVGDCSTDDSTAIQNAINSLTNGGTVYFPPAPGGCYAIGSATAITLPNTKTISLIGSGRSDDGATTTGGTVLKATASITAIINSPTVFARGNSVQNMTLLCNKNAQYGLKLDHTVMGYFAQLAIHDCTLRGIRVGTGAGNSQENTFASIRIDNPQTTVLANLPDYNFETLGDFINNDVYSIKAANAKLSNFNIGGSGNKWTNIHGYDFFSGAAQSPVNNIIISSFNDVILACETDGSSSANISITGFANTIANCTNQGAFGQVGVSFANGTNGNMVYGHIFHAISVANIIVQAGSAITPGNYYWGNFSDAASDGMVGSSITNTIPVTITAGCNGAGSAVQTASNKFYGRITGQTAAATTCTITFNGGGFNTTPSCTVTGEQSAITAVTPSTTTLVITFASTANYRFSYQCNGRG